MPAGAIGAERCKQLIKMGKSKGKGGRVKRGLQRNPLYLTLLPNTTAALQLQTLLAGVAFRSLVVFLNAERSPSK
jgi:hypothetical protein